MPGANYMGGRRNVMKARVKDAVGRQQKDHFGRQRLDILSKGISATKPSELGRAGFTVPALGKSSAQDIELAHARKKIPLDDAVSVRSFIPSPIHVTPRTPPSYNRARTRASEMHISSPGARRSKVLDAVDLSENLFLRRIADQILAMPNLACLPDRNSSKAASKSKANQARRVVDNPMSTPTRSGKRKMSSRDSSEDPDPRRKLDIGERPTFARYTAHSSQEPYTPPRKKRQLSKSYSSASSQPSHCQRNDNLSSEIPSRFLVQQKHNSQSTEGSGSDESDFDSEGIDAIIRSSSLWSPDHRRHSSKTSVDGDEAFQQNHSSSSVSRVLNNPSPPRDEEPINQSFVQHIFDEESDYIPSAIVLGASLQRQKGTRNLTHRLRESQTIYGSLFEKDDPWKTIGIILGLPEMENKMASPKQPDVDREASVSDMDQDELWDFPSQNEVEVVADVLQVEKGEADDNEAEEGEILAMDCEWEVQSPTAPTYKRIIDDELEIHNSRVSELPFPDISVDAEYSSSVHDGEDNGMEVDRRASQETKVIAVGAPGGDENLGVSLAETMTSTAATFRDCQVPEEMPRPIVPDSFGENVMDVGDSDDGCRAGTGDKILGTPELQDVNGRFLGPSLFDDFDETDEEW
ncbi:hypothetical protein BJ912DRAFT_1144857 [Pholiota molesta]|nr:hypothetical protein BJ912DRAFT_1144857 [Pholiota molesta]